MSEFEFMGHHVSAWQEGKVVKFVITGDDGWTYTGSETRRMPVVYSMIRRVIIRRVNR